MKYNIHIFLEDYEYNGDAREISGASARLIAIKGEAVNKLYKNIKVKFHTIKKGEPIQIKGDIKSNDVGLFIRFQYEESLETMKLLQSLYGCKAVAHLCDPHIANIDDPERAKLHKEFISQANALITTSDRLAVIANDYASGFGTYRAIYDNYDLPRLEPHFKREGSLNVVTACYPVHHQSILEALPLLEEAAVELDQGLNYEIVTKRPRKDQSSHGEDVLDDILAFNKNSEKLHINYTEFSMDALQNAFWNAHAYILPHYNRPKDKEFDFKGDIWMGAKSAIRVVQAFQGGIIPIVSGEYGKSIPEAYRAFNHLIRPADDIGQSLKNMLEQSDEKINRMIELGQEIVEHRFSPQATARDLVAFTRNLSF